jgi:hypothetical protein
VFAPTQTSGQTNTPAYARNNFSIPFRQNSFGSATVPSLPGLPDPTTSAANFGFAILSDIEAYFLIQAAQGNTRSNVMQAPKVTLFNGQNAFVSDTTQRPFVTSVIPVVGDFAAAQQPVITVLSEGTAVNVQAVVSSDRRFVRLTLVPFFSQIGKVEEFQFEGSRSTKTKSSDEKSGVDGEADVVGGIGAGAGVTTGVKADREQVYRYSGYPGGLKSETYGEFLARKPADAIRHSVAGMLPKGPLGRQMIKKLKVYAGPDHPHSAQSPVVIDLKAAKAR